MKIDLLTPLTAFAALEEDEVFASFSGFCSEAEKGRKPLDGDSPHIATSALSKISANAEKYGLHGNAWQSWLATLFAKAETPFALAHENGGFQSGSATIDRVALRDAEVLRELFNYPISSLDGIRGGDLFSLFENYVPAKHTGHVYDYGAGRTISALAESLRSAENGEEFLRALSDFYAKNGVGTFALSKAFRWDERNGTLAPITHTEAVSFSDILGCERQKSVLRENTCAFLDGKPANNVLLYGEGGTGKSSSIKALLNEFHGRGLRMIEVYKDSMGALDAIIERVKGRGFKFIIFMDDLSFEQFETDYKYLKAFIEGGLSERPHNVLIYSTSNRRHLMRESWRDRDDKDDDMHESETNQERMSLVDRFGIMLRYSAPDRDGYIEITKKLAEKYGVPFTPEHELEAVRWAMKHGGFSGRSARQYVEHSIGVVGARDLGNLT